MISGMAIIEAEPSLEIGIVDDESVLNLVCLKKKGTNKDVQNCSQTTKENMLLQDVLAGWCKINYLKALM